MNILDGKLISSQIKEELKKTISTLKSKPCIAIIPASNDASSQGYLNMRKKWAEYIGVEVRVMYFESAPTEEVFIECIKALNDDDKIDGIVIDRPLNKEYCEFNIYSALNPLKDIEGCHPYNQGLIAINKTNYLPATAKASIELLKAYDIEFAGKNIVVVGRSLSVGKPLANELINLNATVTVCHSHTKDLAEITSRADILFVSIGKPEFIKKEFIKEGAIIVDIGIHYLDDGRIVGDVDSEAYQKSSFYTPTPGGIGPMTNAMIFTNLLKSYSRR